MFLALSHLLFFRF